MAKRILVIGATGLNANSETYILNSCSWEGLRNVSPKDYDILIVALSSLIAGELSEEAKRAVREILNPRTAAQVCMFDGGEILFLGNPLLRWELEKKIPWSIDDFIAIRLSGSIDKGVAIKHVSAGVGLEYYLSRIAKYNFSISGAELDDHAFVYLLGEGEARYARIWSNSWVETRFGNKIALQLGVTIS